MAISPMWDSPETTSHLQPLAPATTTAVTVTGRHIAVTGDMDVDSQQLICDTVTATGPGATLDLGAVTFLDSAGITTLLHRAQLTTDVRFTSPSPRVRRILERAGLTDYRRIAHDSGGDQ